MSDFELDPRLDHDTIMIGDWPLCRVLMMNESRYPWFILVPRREGLRELHELDLAATAQLWLESRRLADYLQREFSPDKLNIAALGNVVPQLHVHHIARFAGDAAWPAPVWGAHPQAPLPAAELQARCVRTRTALPDLD